MRKSRVATHVALGLVLLCTTAMWTGTASADDGRWKKKQHHHKSRHTPVVVVAGPPCGSRLYAPAYPVYHVPPPVRVCALPRVQRAYYDPYCRESFASLRVYYEHLHHQPHGSVAWVIEGGVPLHGYRRSPDGWGRFRLGMAVSGRSPPGRGCGGRRAGVRVVQAARAGPPLGLTVPEPGPIFVRPAARFR